MAHIKTWRKNLYSNSGYSDNYTDVTFLENLRTNVHQKHVSLKEAALGAGAVTEQMCVVFVFFTIYQIIADKQYATESVFLISLVILGSCYFFYLTNEQERIMQLVYNHSRIIFLFFILGYLLSPVLKTLTETISSDTIDATAIFMMLIHLVFYDYKVPAALASRALSLNASIFASICLASRLQSSLDAFLLLAISATCFVLYPTFVRSQRDKLTFGSLSCLIVTTSFIVILLSSYKLVFFFVICTIFINLVCPLAFVYCQKYKMNIYGPWDEAVIETKRVA